MKNIQAGITRAKSPLAKMANCCSSRNVATRNALAGY